MSEPRRLLDSDPSPEFRALLGSTDLDFPERGGKTRLLVALGLGATTIAAGSAATAGTLAAGSKAAPLGASLVVKWLVLGAALGSIATGTAEAVRAAWTAPSAGEIATATRPATPRSGARAVGQRGESVARPDDAPVLAPRPEDPTLAAPSGPGVTRATAPERAASRPRIGEGASAGPDTPAPSLTLADEVALLDRARAALASRDGRTALALLDAHDERFPEPRLGPEVSVVRIEALVLVGRVLDARRLAEAFLASHPGGTHERHVRALLAEISSRP